MQTIVKGLSIPKVCPVKVKALGIELKKIVVSNISIVAFFVFWEILVDTGIVKDTFVASPSTIIITILKLLESNTLLEHIGISLFRAVAGFIFAVVIAIPLGFFLSGPYTIFRRIVTPVMRLMNAANPFALLPVFILLFGIGEISKIAIIFWVCLWPILLNTIAGIRNVDPLLVKSARSMGMQGRPLFFKVILPAAAAPIFHGLKMSCGTAFFMLIAAEMIGASTGLGWMVWNAQINYQIPKLFAVTFIISVLGLSLNYLFVRIEKNVLSWQTDDTEY
ncbi:ABC transporter permease [Pectinatus frisingensis]|uniref:ABC transporter permease n=1 Tax=Pectinatus frisingensis TaxID=865 RepID=UPI0015F3D7E3|nr:ABC transporter permease [Pectinatus frisingensis]